MTSTKSLVTSDTRWSRHVDAVRDFAASEGSTRVPSDYVVQVEEEGRVLPVRLGAWVTYVRQQYRKGFLADTHIRDLESIEGWEWGPFKPGPKGDTERNAGMREHRNAGCTLAQIADMYGLSRQRVHQILGASRAVARD